MIAAEVGIYAAAALPFVPDVISVLLWLILLSFLLANLIWVAEVVSTFPWSSTDTAGEHPPDDVQVRVLTIGAEDVVQKTVDSIPADLADRHVVAEEPISIDGATVHVVPDSFDCDAIRKGRALEWARRNVPCDKEYVLYIDEDSVISELPALPDADVVQFSECPTRTRSLMTYLADLFRIGFQVEQRAFPRMKIPLYAWGGGLAIRKELEDEVTWNYDTIIEDTVFVWKASEVTDLDFEIVPVKFYNQVAPTIPAMIRQRRRWVAGAVNDLHLLPRSYQLLFLFRTFVWSISPVVPVLGLLSLAQDSILFTRYYFLLSMVLTAFLYFWAFLGVWYAEESVSTAIAMVFLTPFISLLHSAGALVGLVSPTRDFDVTDKVSPGNITSDSVAYEHED